MQGPGSLGTVSFLIIVTTSPNSGLFVYSVPVPAPNTLADSVAAVAGTDLEGNRVLPGHASYGFFAGVWFATTLTQAGIAFYIGGATQAAAYGLVATLGLSALGTRVVTQLSGGDFALATTGGTNLTAWISPSGDTTGANDTAAIQAALNAVASVTLLAGTFYLNAPLLLNGQTFDLGGATIQPGSGWSGNALLTINGNQVRIRNGRLYGGSTTRSANPVQDAIRAAIGIVAYWVDDLIVEYVNGWSFNAPAMTAVAIGTIHGVIGHNNAGGIQLAAPLGQSAQVNISDINLQTLEVNESLRLVNVFDVAVSNFNSSVNGSAGVPTVRLAGQVSTCNFANVDCGVIGTATAGIGTLQIEDSGGNSPQDISFNGGTFAAGGIGILVTGGASRIRWHGVMAFGNQLDGWKFTGTGVALAVIGCMGNFNNQAAGVAYDMDITSTAHVGLNFFTYDSTACTNARNITVAGNHVQDNLPTNPGALANAGFAPAGWL